MKVSLSLILIIVFIVVALFVLGFNTHAPAEPISINGDSSNATIGSNEHSIYDDSMHLELPRAGATVTSPLVVRGEARGVWFFEATFPLILVDEDGAVLAQGFATATDDWMSEGFVPFEGTLTFIKPAKARQATLILMKDNPSGLPEHQDERTVQVYLSEE